MFTIVIFTFIFFLPAAFLPVALDGFASKANLNEMGVSLENADDTFPMQGYELVGFLPASQKCDAWEFNEPLQTC